MDGYRSSSAQAAFKVPKVPKKPAESSAARRPSATGGKLGTASSVVVVSLFVCLFLHGRMKILRAMICKWILKTSSFLAHLRVNPCRNNLMKPTNPLTYCPRSRCHVGHTSQPSIPCRSHRQCFTGGCRTGTLRLCGLFEEALEAWCRRTLQPLCCSSPVTFPSCWGWFRTICSY